MAIIQDVTSNPVPIRSGLCERLDSMGVEGAIRRFGASLSKLNEAAGLPGYSRVQQSTRTSPAAPDKARKWASADYRWRRPPHSRQPSPHFADAIR